MSDLSPASKPVDNIAYARLTSHDSSENLTSPLLVHQPSYWDSLNKAWSVVKGVINDPKFATGVTFIGTAMTISGSVLKGNYQPLFYIGSVITGIGLEKLLGNSTKDYQARSKIIQGFHSVQNDPSDPFALSPPPKADISVFEQAPSRSVCDRIGQAIKRAFNHLQNHYTLEISLGAVLLTELFPMTGQGLICGLLGMYSINKCRQITHYLVNLEVVSQRLFRPDATPFKVVAFIKSNKLFLLTLTLSAATVTLISIPYTREKIEHAISNKIPNQYAQEVCRIAQELGVMVLSRPLGYIYSKIINRAVRNMHKSNSSMNELIATFFMNAQSLLATAGFYTYGKANHLLGMVIIGFALGSKDHQVDVTRDRTVSQYFDRISTIDENQAQIDLERINNQSSHWRQNAIKIFFVVRDHWKTVALAGVTTWVGFENHSVMIVLITGIAQYYLCRLADAIIKSNSSKAVENAAWQYLTLCDTLQYDALGIALYILRNGMYFSDDAYKNVMNDILLGLTGAAIGNSHHRMRYWKRQEFFPNAEDSALILSSIL